MLREHCLCLSLNIFFTYQQVSDVCNIMLVCVSLFSTTNNVFLSQLEIRNFVEYDYTIRTNPVSKVTLICVFTLRVKQSKSVILLFL